MTLETIVRDQLKDLELKEQLWLTEQEERVGFITEQVNAHNQWMAENRLRIAGLRGGIESLRVALNQLDAVGEDIDGDSE